MPLTAAFIEHAKFELWDTAGQERYRSLAPMYYRGAAAAIIVFDLTDEESLDGAKAWVKELRVRGEGSVVIALVGTHFTSLHLISLYCTSLHYTSLHPTSVQFTALHCLNLLYLLTLHA